MGSVLNILQSLHQDKPNSICFFSTDVINGVAFVTAQVTSRPTISSTDHMTGTLEQTSGELLLR